VDEIESPVQFIFWMNLTAIPNHPHSLYRTHPPPSPSTLTLLPHPPPSPSSLTLLPHPPPSPFSLTLLPHTPPSLSSTEPLTSHYNFSLHDEASFGADLLLSSGEQHSEMLRTEFCLQGRASYGVNILTVSKPLVIYSYPQHIQYHDYHNTMTIVTLLSYLWWM